jgi:hypothetical protein
MGSLFYDMFKLLSIFFPKKQHKYFFVFFSSCLIIILTIHTTLTFSNQDHSGESLFDFPPIFPAKQRYDYGSAEIFFREIAEENSVTSILFLQDSIMLDQVSIMLDHDYVVFSPLRLLIDDPYVPRYPFTNKFICNQDMIIDSDVHIRQAHLERIGKEGIGSEEKQELLKKLFSIWDSCKKDFDMVGLYDNVPLDDKNSTIYVYIKKS